MASSLVKPTGKCEPCFRLVDGLKELQIYYMLRANLDMQTVVSRAAADVIHIQGRPKNLQDMSEK